MPIILHMKNILQKIKMATKHIYNCLVLTGEYTTGRADMTAPPVKNPEVNPSILYNSLVNDENNPSIFVAVKDAQAYPQYLIVFKMNT